MLYSRSLKMVFWENKSHDFETRRIMSWYFFGFVGLAFRLTVIGLKRIFVSFVFTHWGIVIIIFNGCIKNDCVIVDFVKYGIIVNYAAIVTLMFFHLRNTFFTWNTYYIYSRTKQYNDNPNLNNYFLRLHKQRNIIYNIQ